MSKPVLIGILSFGLVCAAVCCRADEHQHDHASAEVIERPKIFLDKSPRIVEYQLKRLDNRRLLLVERAADDPRYLPVHQAILLRPGMAMQAREEAVGAMATIRSTDVVLELLGVLSTLDPNQSAEMQVAGQLTLLLLQQSTELLVSHQAELGAAAAADLAPRITAGLAGLMVIGESKTAWELAVRDDLARKAWLTAVSLLPSAPLRAAQRSYVVELIEGESSRDVIMAALPVLARIESGQADAFRRIAVFADDQTLRDAAVRALLTIPHEFRDAGLSRELVQLLVRAAEETEAARRTTDEFVDAMTLAEQLLRQLDPAEAQAFRQRMRAVSVRVIRIRTVHEEMRYDTPYFAVEAGRPVQIVLQNDDLMPHNLVLTRPGTLQQVAVTGAELGPDGGADGRPYVPVSDDVLFATSMVEAGRQEVMTFDAPQVPGEYPYVCTFPRHWMRMYGVMVVVDDLDAWQRSGMAPADPLGNTRSFVQSWNVSDFSGDLGASIASHSAASGEKLFHEATCRQCHQIRRQGGQVGPDLTDVLTRWKGDYRGVLREILDPSYKIDPRYVVQVVLLNDGRTLSGIVQAEDDKSIRLLVNPERPEPQTILRSDIEELIPSATSMMPKALLDKFTREEILDLMAYIIAHQQPVTETPEK